jgi:hypothetical protein
MQHDGEKIWTSSSHLIHALAVGVPALLSSDDSTPDHRFIFGRGFHRNVHLAELSGIFLE